MVMSGLSVHLTTLLSCASLTIVVLSISCTYYLLTTTLFESAERRITAVEKLFHDQSPPKYGTGPGSNSRPLDLQPDMLLTDLSGPKFTWSLPIAIRCVSTTLSQQPTPKVKVIILTPNLIRSCYTQNLQSRVRAISPARAGLIPHNMIISKAKLTTDSNLVLCLNHLSTFVL